MPTSESEPTDIAVILRSHLYNNAQINKAFYSSFLSLPQFHPRPQKNQEQKNKKINGEYIYLPK